MAKKDRDYDTILKGCRDFANAVQATRAAASLLSKEATVAEGTLKDRVAKKNIDAIKDLSETIMKTTALGEDRVRELERKMTKEKEWVETHLER